MSQPDAPGPLAVLSSASATLAQTMAALAALEGAEGPCQETVLGVSSNVTVDLLSVFLRKQAILNGVRLKVVQGNFDDPEGDVQRFLRAGIEQMLLLPCFDNLMPFFEAQAAHLPAAVLEAKEGEFRAHYRLVFERASAMKCLYLGTLCRFSGSSEPGGDRVDQVLQRFNQALSQEAAAFPNIRLIDMGECLLRVGRSSAFDPRFYFSAKAPYTTALFDELARAVVAASRAFGSRFLKVLVLDCDNTLWGGVVGEDLLEGLKLGPNEHPGNIFWLVQNELAALEQRGILLCLCSKNNPGEVAEVLARHPWSVLRAENFILQKVNWTDKVTNLKEIAQELNLGLDSMVFLDDSPFECAAVRAQLPMVRTCQVPARLSDYPELVRTIKEWFLAGGLASEGSKTEQYRIRGLAEALKERAHSHEEYLASLGLKVSLTRNDRSQIRRISELSLKSNQFNLTTRRCSEADIQGLMDSGDHQVYALTVSDRFGDSGLTGVLIMRWEGEVARVHSFLMSCRVIGRGIESAIWGFVLEDARRMGCTTFGSEYLPTDRNGQVAEFYDGLGIPMAQADADGARRYRIAIDAFLPPVTPWIEVIDAG